ncbi:MAG: heavy metal translocating P-type ATPase [Kiritimatiellae bacterium]|nr:heavy metal translocating P-type ATPase [Kiritimatiellia bacterium]
MMQEVKTTRAYRIEGMDCAEEVATLKSALKDVPGIAELRFDVLNGKMTVLCAPAGCEEDDIVVAVGSTGMRAIPWQKKADTHELSLWQRKGRVVLTAASGLFTGAGLVLHWSLHGSLLNALSGGSRGAAFPAGVSMLYALGIITGAWFVIPKAISAARRLRPDMNLLMTVAVIGAVAIGEWFEAAAIAFLFSLSLVLESWSVGRARHAISKLMDLSPTRARYISPDHGEIIEGSVEDVPCGVTVLVRPGEKVPLDGIVTKGETSINQAPITGESLPVGKGEGDEVFAGTINEEGAFEFRCTKVASDSTLARIIHMVEEAQSRRATSEQWVERFARYYTPAMMLLALCIAILPPVFGGSWSEWFYQALVMLVIACPCALVISTPVSIVAGLASAARAGVLIKGGVFLELPAKLRALALDKTGTLTYGMPEVQSIHALNGHTEEEVLSRAAALESESGHPIARAILREAGRRGIVAPGADGLRDIQGRGAEAQINGKRYWIGSHRFMHEKGAETPDIHALAVSIEDAAHTLVALGSESHICALIGISDRVRETAAESVRAMRQAGIEHVVMLTGDNQATAAAIAKVTGITEYQAEMLPEDKVAAVEALVGKYGYVAMIGDGVNDAPAMAVSSLGIAMGAAGTDAAIETADIALMSDDLSRIPWLIRHSRRVMHVIQQNIGFALGIKALFMVLALAGVATLWMAIVADMGASLLVIANALRLLRSAPCK